MLLLWLSGCLGQGPTACVKNQLELQSCWPQSTQGSGEAGCGGLQPVQVKKRGLTSAYTDCESWCLVCVKTQGKLCNCCDHLKRLAECVSIPNILFWGFFTWYMELCLEFVFPEVTVDFSLPKIKW